MKKYESPEFLLAKYEIDESIAVEVSGVAGDTNIDNDSFDNMFGN